MTTLSNAVTAHYASAGLAERILAALVEAGVDLDTLTPEDLAPLDQFHVRGKDATIELAQAAGVNSKHKIVDVGGGIGGPARTLAAQFGCDFTVVDLTDEYCRAGEVLTMKTGLEHRVRFTPASALDMPFEEESFDLAWQQHSSMNIPDKRMLYKEIARVLRPGGRLALYEIMAGESGEVRYPVPWARVPSISHLGSPDDMRAAMIESGFTVSSWRDQTDMGAEWFRARLSANAGQPAPPKLGLHLLVGDVAAIMFRNMLDNLERRSVVIVQAILDKS
jgi:ubiquinone/menaquinone biosynthesis C-methylase UbiE